MSKAYQDLREAVALAAGGPLPDDGEIVVIEWPQPGAAKRIHSNGGGGGWFAAEYRERRGYLPIAGPYPRRDQAAAARMAAIMGRAAASVLPCGAGLHPAPCVPAECSWQLHHAVYFARHAWRCAVAAGEAVTI
jgi:hypothetical protein